MIVDFPLEGAHATTRYGVCCCGWCVVMYGLVGARDVRSYVPLLVFDWKVLAPPRGMVHVMVGGGLLGDDVCGHVCLCLLLALRALRARGVCSSLLLLICHWKELTPPRGRVCIVVYGLWRCTG